MYLLCLRMRLYVLLCQSPLLASKTGRVLLQTYIEPDFESLISLILRNRREGVPEASSRVQGGPSKLREYGLLFAGRHTSKASRQADCRHHMVIELVGKK